jgi:PAS domain S-box-containing protein
MSPGGNLKIKLQDLIDIEQFQMLQDRLNEIYSFPSAIVDNDGNILTATAWQDVCTRFHRQNQECAQECVNSDQYILSHLTEAQPVVSYRCPRGLMNNATPIIIDGVHYGSFLTGQFFMESPDLEFFRQQAQRYGFDEQDYLEAVRRVPVWTHAQLNSYLVFIQGLIDVISSVGLKNFREIESRQKIEETQEHLRATTAQLETIIQNSPLAICLLGASSQVEVWNPAAEKIFGWTAKEVIGRPNPIVPPARQEEYDRLSSQVLSGKAIVQQELVRQRKDGSFIEVAITSAPVYNAAGELSGRFAIIADITDRKQAEEQIRLFKYSIDTAPDGAYWMDRKGRFLYVNDAGCKALGYNREEMEQLCITDINPYVTPQGWELVWQTIIKQQSPTTESTHRRKDGSEFPVEITSTYIKFGDQEYCNGFARDITGRKKAEDNVRRSEAKFRAVLESSNDGILFSDARGLITYRSPSYQQIDGYTVEERLGHSGFEIVHPDDVESVRQAWAQTLQQLGKPQKVECRIRHKNGSWRWIDINIQNLLDNPDVQGVVVASRDITGRKLAEEQIRKALAEKETLLRELYHRTKNNMGVINALLDLQASEMNDERLSKALTETQRRIQSMALVHQKLYEAQDVSHINLKDYVNDLMNLLLSGFSALGNRVTYLPDMEDVFVLIDTAIPCGLVMNELITNALKYAFPDGRSGQIAVRLHRLQNGEIEFSVSDNGPGFPLDFDPRRDGGMGL